LRQLSLRDIEQLMQALLAPEIENKDAQLTQFAAWLFAETDGQPLFLTETLKALVADGLVQPTAIPAPAVGAAQAAGQAAWRIDWSRFGGPFVADRRFAYMKVALFVLAFHGILTYRRIGLHADHLPAESIRRRDHIMALRLHFVPGAIFCM
jgi:hypothetical protein